MPPLWLVVRIGQDSSRRQTRSRRRSFRRILILTAGRRVQRRHLVFLVLLVGHRQQHLIEMVPQLLERRPLVRFVGPTITHHQVSVRIAFSRRTPPLVFKISFYLRYVCIRSQNKNVHYDRKHAIFTIILVFTWNIMCNSIKE